MKKNWTEQRQQAEWRRRRQVVGLVALVLVFSGVWLYANRARPSGNDEVASEFKEERRPVDTSPFRQLLPDNSGSTTLPSGALGIADPIEGPAGDLPTTSVTITSQTEVQVRATANIDSLCGSAMEMLSFVNLVDDKTLDAKALTEQLLANVDRYVEVAPEAYRADVVAIRTNVQQVVAVLAQAGWDTSAPQFTYAIESIGRSAPPYQAFEQHFARLQEIDTASCDAQSPEG